LAEVDIDDAAGKVRIGDLAQLTGVKHRLEVRQIQANSLCGIRDFQFVDLTAASSTGAKLGALVQGLGVIRGDIGDIELVLALGLRAANLAVNRVEYFDNGSSL